VGLSADEKPGVLDPGVADEGEPVLLLIVGSGGDEDVVGPIGVDGEGGGLVGGCVPEGEEGSHGPEDVVEGLVLVGSEEDGGDHRLECKHWEKVL